MILLLLLLLPSSILSRSIFASLVAVLMDYFQNVLCCHCCCRSYSPIHCYWCGVTCCRTFSFRCCIFFRSRNISTSLPYLCGSCSCTFPLFKYVMLCRRVSMVCCSFVLWYVGMVYCGFVLCVFPYAFLSILFVCLAALLLPLSGSWQQTLYGKKTNKYTVFMEIQRIQREIGIYPITHVIICLNCKFVIYLKWL